MNSNSRSTRVLSVFTAAVIAMLLGVLYQLHELDKSVSKLIEQSNTEVAMTNLESPTRVTFPHTLEQQTQICFQQPNDDGVVNHINYTVVSDVYQMPRGEDKGGMMEVVELKTLDGERTIITLAELGVLSYPGGTWGEGRTFFGHCLKGG